LHGPLRRNGVSIDLAEYQRYDNRFVQASFPADRVRIEANNSWLELDWNTATRRWGDEGDNGRRSQRTG
jgi:hypothetical protein